ncbi:MAG: ThuA domain-containing protein [Planctomycetota bacterium]|jgi:type 1 glutamine amidotransferase
MPSALFVWGGWAGHEPRACVEIFAPLVEAAGLDPVVADTLDAFDDAAALRRHDVIVPCWTMGELSADRETAMLDAVRAGTGVAGWHGGLGDAFRAATGWQFMVGGQFVAHPEGAVDFEVRLVARDHPVTRGLADFAVRTEQYYLHVDPVNEVLADTVIDGRLAPEVAGVRMPVAWVRRFGAGRVFYCALGHGARDFDHPTTRELVRRGILWAAGHPGPVS